jgi:DNA-binding transcriptional MerR regulator
MSRLRIGEVAAQAGVTTRTLRYYQEVGLLSPETTAGGTRMYTENDVERLRRILELREAMGFDLDRIRLILDTEDRLAQMRAEVQRGVSMKRRREMVDEALELNARVQEEVQVRRGLLDGYLAELKAKAHRYREILAETDSAAKGARRTR